MHLIHKLCKLCNFVQKNRPFNIIILSLHYQEQQIMYVLFKDTLRELSKCVPVGIPKFGSKSGKRPLIQAQTRRFNIKVALTLVKRSLILEGTDKRETSYIKEETVSTQSIIMWRIFEVINRDMVCALGSEKNTLNEGPVFAVQDGFCR